MSKIGMLSLQVSDEIDWVFIAMFYAIYDHLTELKFTKLIQH